MPTPLSQFERIYKTGCGTCCNCDPISVVAFLCPRGHMLQYEDLCSEVKCILPLKTLATKHKPKPQMIVSLDPKTSRRTCGVDSGAITIFLMVLQSLMAQTNINHGISRADSVFLGQPSLLLSDLLSVCLLAQCW